MIPPSDTADEPTENFDRVNALNLRGVWACRGCECRRVQCARFSIVHHVVSALDGLMF